MSQLVFQSVSGGSITLNGTNTAGTYNLTVPAADGTLLYQDTSGNITFDNVTITGQLTLSGTGALRIPQGNTAQRPAPPAAGEIRYNTDGGGLYEGYLPAIAEWYKFDMSPQGQYTIQYLMIAGGGGGGCPAGVASSGNGGGGAGGYFESNFTAIPATSFTIVVGAGGSGASSSKGTNSYITGVSTVYGGGAGAGAGDTSGGSGGGGGPYPPGAPLFQAKVTMVEQDHHFGIQAAVAVALALLVILAEHQAVLVAMVKFLLLQEPQ